MYVTIQYLMKEKDGVKFINIFTLRSKEEKRTSIIAVPFTLITSIV